MRLAWSAALSQHNRCCVTTHWWYWRLLLLRGGPVSYNHQSGRPSGGADGVPARHFTVSWRQRPIAATPAALGWCSWRARFARVAYKSSKAPTGRHSCLRCPPSPPAPSWKLMDVSGRSLSPAALQLMIRLQAPCIVGAKRVGGMCDDGELASSLVQIVMEIARRFYPTRICPATSMAT